MRNSTTFSHVNSRSTRERTRKKGQEENEGISDSTQRSYLTIPSRFDAAGGCSRHVVSPTPSVLSPPFAPLSPFLTHTYTHTNEAHSLILVVPVSSSSILTSLYRSRHVSLGAGSDPPDFESTVAGLCLPLL